MLPPRTASMPTGRAMLANAVKEGSLQLMSIILREFPEDVDQHDSDGLSALHYAARKGDEEKVVLLLNHKANPNNKSRKNGNTMPIHSAFSCRDWSKSFKVISHLIAAGAHLNEENTAHETPLVLALTAGRDPRNPTLSQRYSIINLLLFHGASRTLKHNGAWASYESNLKALNTSPLMTAIYSFPKNKNDLIIAAKANDYEAVRRLSLKITLRVKDEIGNNPLHYAVFNYNIPLIQFLLRYNRFLIADKNNKGRTPIEESLAMGQGFFALGALMGWNVNEASQEGNFMPITDPFPVRVPTNSNSASLAARAAQAAAN